MNQYAHMCRMDHEEIGHNDSEHEQCPLCRANNRADALAAQAKRAIPLLEWASTFSLAGGQREFKHAADALRAATADSGVDVKEALTALHSASGKQAL